MLEAQFPHLLSQIAVGLFGSGSECFGYDDDISRDHDFEPGFMLLLPGEDAVDRRAAFLLERAYAAKRDFGCTASFTSLLFYERRSLRHGGFFLSSPYPEHVDRVDMMWAVLADIACATYEQLWRLRELSSHTRDYVLGCGGGFRSKALCQMLSDLSGLELRLRPGFEQATVLGLTSLCNQALGLETSLPETGDALVFHPGTGDLIRRYHALWNPTRLAATPPVVK